jgi:hypothetical protein
MLQEAGGIVNETRNVSVFGGRSRKFRLPALVANFPRSQ